MMVIKKQYSEKGQSLVEFAFTAVFMFLLLAGIVDLGRAFFSYMAIRDAAQEGAAYGSAFPSDRSGIENRVRETSQTPVPLSDSNVVSVEINPPPESTSLLCEGNGNLISVTVQYNYQITTPLIGSIVGSQIIDLSTTVSDTILRPPCE